MSTFWSELWTLVAALLLFALVLGCLLFILFIFQKFFKFLDRKPSKTHGLSLSKVHFIITIILLVAAVYSAVTTKVSAHSILQYIFPTEDFERIQKMCEDVNEGWAINNILYVFMQEFANTFLYIFPVFLLDFIYALCSLFCKADEKNNTKVVDILKIIASLAIAVIFSSIDFVYHLGQYSDMIALESHDPFNPLRGLIVEVLLGLPLTLMVVYSIKALFSNKIILTLLGFNAARILIRTPLEPWQEVLYIIICFVCAYLFERIQNTKEIDVDKDDIEYPVKEVLHTMLNGFFYFILAMCIGIPFMFISKYIF